MLSPSAARHARTRLAGQIQERQHQLLRVIVQRPGPQIETLEVGERRALHFAREAQLAAHMLQLGLVKLEQRQLLLQR